MWTDSICFLFEITLNLFTRNELSVDHARHSFCINSTFGIKQIRTKQWPLYLKTKMLRCLSKRGMTSHLLKLTEEKASQMITRV